MEYVIYSDGACSGNPGPGGYAWEIWQLTNSGDRKIGSGQGCDSRTTNNIMELEGFRQALDEFLELDPYPARVRLRLDSEYVLKGAFEWMPAWKRRGWKTASKKPVLNQGLWEQIDILIRNLREAGFDLKPDWVRGHSGDEGNERVDLRAQEMRNRAKELQGVF